MKQVFDTKPKTLHLESHLSAILFKRSICYPLTCRKFCVIPQIIFEHPKVPSIHNAMMDTLAVVGKLRQSIKKIHIAVEYIVHRWYRTMQFAFLINNIHVGVELKWQYFLWLVPNYSQQIKMTNTSVSIVISRYLTFFPVV